MNNLFKTSPLSRRLSPNYNVNIKNPSNNKTVNGKHSFYNHNKTSHIVGKASSLKNS